MYIYIYTQNYTGLSPGETFLMQCFCHLGIEAPDSHGHWWLRWWHKGTLFLNDRRPLGRHDGTMWPIFLLATNNWIEMIGNWHRSCEILELRKWSQQNLRETMGTKKVLMDGWHLWTLKNKCIAARSKWIWLNNFHLCWDPLTSPPARAELLHPHTSGFLQSTCGASCKIPSWRMSGVRLSWKKGEHLAHVEKTSQLQCTPWKIWNIIFLSKWVICRFHPS